MTDLLDIRLTSRRITSKQLQSSIVERRRGSAELRVHKLQVDVRYCIYIGDMS
jgi:hypothetical protein